MPQSTVQLSQLCLISFTLYEEPWPCRTKYKSIKFEDGTAMVRLTDQILSTSPAITHKILCLPCYHQAKLHLVLRSHGTTNKQGVSLQDSFKHLRDITSNIWPFSEVAPLLPLKEIWGICVVVFLLYRSEVSFLWHQINNTPTDSLTKITLKLHKYCSNGEFKFGQKVDKHSVCTSMKIDI